MANRYLAPKIPGRGDQPSTDRYIGQAHMTAWERRYNDFRPFGSYPIRPEWDELDRDFIAYWQLAMQKLVKEYGRHDIKPVLAIDRWLLPVMRDGTDPNAAPEDAWDEYDKATTGGGGVRSTRNHADGRVLDEKGETVGRWDDNRGGIRRQAISRGEDPDEAEDAWRARQASQTILDKVKRWAAETHHGADHVRRWQEAANGIVPGTFPDAATMTSTEASEYAVRFMASRWDPAARAIRDREIGFTGGGTVDAQLEETLKVINERPDVEVLEYNPETNTLDLLPPAETSQIAPEHVDRFCEYLERERALVAKECGSGHPAIKCKVYEGYIEDVRSGERVHSQIMFNYGQFLGWLRGEYGQRTAKETTLWADGSEGDHSEAAFKAEQDAYAEEVARFQAAAAAGVAGAEQGFDEWRRENKAMFPFNGVYVLDARSQCLIPFDKVSMRRAELTAENVRYRLDCERPDGVRQISWLALNYEGCLCVLPHYDKEKAEATRMVEARDVPGLIAAGWRVLTDAEYADNQRRKNAVEDRFEAFRLYVQYDPDGNPLGICPTQGGVSNWEHNADLFARMQGKPSATTTIEAPCDTPAGLADAIARGDWAEVARLATERAGK